MNDLDKAKELMRERDHHLFRTAEANHLTHLGLADEVPGLVEEIEELRAEVANLTSKVNTALEEKERWRLRAEAAEREFQGFD